MLPRSSRAATFAVAGALLLCTVAGTTSPAFAATATPSASPTATTSPTPSATPTPTVSPIPTATPAPSVAPTATPSASPTPAPVQKPSDRDELGAPGSSDAPGALADDAAAPHTTTRFAETSTGTTLVSLLDSLRVAAPSTVKYDRARFEEGVVNSGTGCRTRPSVLRQESLSSVTTGSSSCDIRAGLWDSWYDGARITDPTLLEMDHLVALKEAWISGAERWSDSQRRDYANDIADPATLTMVLSASNQSKSAADPASWLPPRAAARCTYLQDWVIVKARWNLSVDSAEKSAITTALKSNSCGNPATRVPEIRRDTAISVPPTSPGAETGGVLTPFSGGTHRVFGADRYATAVELTRAFSPGIPVVYIAVGTNYPDALSAGPAAAVQGGGLLLVNRDSVPAVVREELTRLAPAKIVVVGGEAVISASVYRELSTLSPSIRRDAGADRYQTSNTVVRRAFSSASTAFLATGLNFPDALSASAAAGSLHAPVLLVNGAAGAVDKATKTLLGELGATSIRIAGGTAVVSTKIEESLVAIVGRAGVTRLAGADRFATSAAINAAVFPAGTPVFLATGRGFADALAGGAIAAQTGHALYISESSCIPESISRVFRAAMPTGRVLLGGPTVLGQGVENLTSCSPPAPPAPPKPPAPPAAPAGPAPSSSVNCSDFATHSQAQQWFEYYRPQFGDIAGLDRDNDGLACETLPG